MATPTDQAAATAAASNTAQPAGESNIIAAQDDVESDTGDSAYSDDESYTTSLKSSITAYEFRHGRRYHAYQAGRYPLPNDEQEQDRLDMQYFTLRLAFDDKLFFAPIGDSPQAVLDVGTGTGIWAIDFGDLYPSAEVIGTDLSPIQPKWVPPNVKFEVDDAEQTWLFPADHFDLVHTRLMSGGIRDWPLLFRQSFKHCKPGGWVECQELDVDARSDDSSFPDDSAILRWCANQETAAQKAGVTLRIYGDVLEQQMRAAGFINVVVRKFKIPIGVWPADEKMREVGCAQLITMLEGLEGLTIAFWVGMLGWKPEEVSVFLAMVRNEFKSRKVHSYWPVYAVYGQKPESGR